MDQNTKNVLSTVISLIEKLESDSTNLSTSERLLMTQNLIGDLKNFCQDKLPPHISHSEGSGGTQISRETETKKILIVDDDAGTLLTMRVALEQTGYQVNIIPDPFIASNIVEKLKPDLIILDLMMPQMTGFEFLQMIRSNKAYDDMKIIIGSSRNNEEDMRHVFKAGADNFIAKPFDLAQLVNMIEETLEMKRH